MLPSFGARADRIMQLLLVPLVGASTAALQMFLPGGAPILSFLRVYQFTRAMQDLVEFLFLLNGSQQHILDSLPKEKITLFSKFPLCCVFGWSCCAHRPRLGHLRFFVAGIRQFNWLMPLLGVISVYMESQNYPYDDPIETVCRTLTTVSTFFAMWAFKCLLPLMTYSITATTVDPDRIAHMERFVLLQYPAAKVLGLIVPVVIKQNLVSEQWVMPNAIYVTIVEGFMLTLFQLGMAVLGACAYTADEHLYPELDEANDFPPDAIALLDMNGVDVTRWKRLQPFHDF